jgi:hypothetical protein
VHRGVGVGVGVGVGAAVVGAAILAPRYYNSTACGYAPYPPCYIPRKSLGGATSNEANWAAAMQPGSKRSPDSF